MKRILVLFTTLLLAPLAGLRAAEGVLHLGRVRAVVPDVVGFHATSELVKRAGE